MQTTPFKYRALVVALCMMLLNIGETQAQFIRLTINLPAGFEAKPETTDPQVLNPPNGGDVDAIGLRKQGTRWIEFRTRENVQMSISATFDSKIGGLPKLYFLNNNTTDFNAAYQISPYRSVVSMYNRMELMNDLNDESTYFSAWLGIPYDRSGVLTIEFL